MFIIYNRDFKTDGGGFPLGAKLQVGPERWWSGDGWDSSLSSGTEEPDDGIIPE